MDDVFKYPLFFDCGSGLQPEHKKKIEHYFQIKRLSGGGECGPLKRVNENIYSVAFKDQKDQQNVLRKSEHVVEGLVFTVRDNLESSKQKSTRHQLDGEPSETTTRDGGETNKLLHVSQSFGSLSFCEVTTGVTTVPSNDWRGNLLNDNRGEVWDRRLQGTSAENRDPSDWGSQFHTSVQDDAASGTVRATENCVCFNFIQGTIETQQVDALVSPMVGHDPCSTKIGLTLSSKVGPQLKARFRKETREGTTPGDAVMIEGLPGLPSDAIFFLNLAHWDGDEDGVAAEVLRLGISSVLEACEERGFTSVAFPILGAGVVLNFPRSIVARILLEEVQKFRQYRGRGTSLLVNIVIHPKDKESREAFNDVIQASTTKRIVLLGKTGSGKSNLANTIFGEELFSTNHTPNSGTSQCRAETRSINGRNVTLIDTPGFFDAVKSEEELKPEVVRCLTECAPGPHAFLIVLKVEKFTKQEQDVITQICQYFSEDALKYAVIVFTHGDQLPPGMTIEEFVSKNKKLSDLVQKSGGRCHVIDNKYWENNEKDDYRDNCLQVKKLLHTIDKMVMENNGGYYTNEVLEIIEREIQEEEEHIRQMHGDLPTEEIKTQAKAQVHKNLLPRLSGVATGAVIAGFLGFAAVVLLPKLVAKMPPAAAVGTVAGVVGGMFGQTTSEGAETALEAAKKTASEVRNRGKAAFNSLRSLLPDGGSTT